MIDWHIPLFKSKAFKELYRMGGCRDMIHSSSVKRLAIYLGVLFPMTVAKEDWDKFFDLLPGLADSEWAEMLEYMHKFFLTDAVSAPDSVYLNRRLDWINGLDTIREFS